MSSHESGDDEQSKDSELSLRDIMRAVKRQGERLDIIREEINEQSLSVSAEVKRLKTSTETTWRSEGNKIQYHFNSDILEDLKQVGWAIGNHKYSYSKETLKDAIVKLEKRNKLIRISDTSEGGWGTARSYEQNAIASDSEDESRINRANREALRKQRLKKQKSATKPSASASASYMPTNYSFRTQTALPFTGVPIIQSPVGNWSLSQGIPQQNQPRRGACYTCGSFTHLRKDCPLVKPPENKPQ